MWICRGSGELTSPSGVSHDGYRELHDPAPDQGATVSSYDAIPYPSLVWTPSQPERLAALAALRGLRPAPPQRARILEVFKLPECLDTLAATFREYAGSSADDGEGSTQGSTSGRPSAAPIKA